MKLLDDVEHLEPFLLVPYKMHLSVKGTKEHKVLREICRLYPECFEDSVNWEHLTLCLRLIYEMALGTQSFWYPYLRILPSDASELLPSFWEYHQVEAL